jgi:hypothetical protein
MALPGDGRSRSGVPHQRSNEINETFANEKGATFVITFYIVWRSLFPRYPELIAADDPQVTDLHMTTHLTL